MSPTLWNTQRQIPAPVMESSRDSGRTITVEEWMDWQFHERYALYKTAVSKNEPEKFRAVLAELRQRRAAS